MKRINSTLLLLLLAAVLPCPNAASDVVIDWNHIASDVLLANTTLQNPGMASRSMAMMNLAIYDAVNGVHPTHQQLYAHEMAPSGASASAAAVQSAYRVLSSLYPDQQSLIDDRRVASLAAIPDGPAKSIGIGFGDIVGTNIVSARSADGSDSVVSYTPVGGAGHWEPDPLNPAQEAWGPGWGGVTPFAIPDTSFMMPPPMPDLTSDEYTVAFTEVQELGARHGSTRTAEQTEIALFWAYDRLGMGTPMRMYNSILRTVAANQGNDLSENARMFAMATTSIADAGVTAWESKFVFDFWRPVSGIRRANEDGNPATVPDANWEPLGAPGGIAPDGSTINDFTPPFPTYLSGHASFGGALFESLSNFYGTDDIAFDVTSDELPGVVRSYDSFSEASVEQGRSRVYLGIHWNFDDTRAREMGAMTADYVSANYFQPVPEPVPGWWLGCGLLWFFGRCRGVHT
jgi:hypothetical protein